jgi:hypothetical protein
MHYCAKFSKWQYHLEYPCYIHGHIQESLPEPLQKPIHEPCQISALSCLLALPY